MTIEHCATGEELFSYAQVPYLPLASADGRWRTSNLLMHTADHEGVGPAMTALCRRARDAFGLNRTAWGVKLAGSELEWELYWYDHSDDVALTTDRVARVAGPAPWQSPDHGDQQRRWWSLSFDLHHDRAGGLEVGALHLYTPRPGTPGTCASYRSAPGRPQLENVYYLFDGTELAGAQEWVRSSAAHPDVSAVLWPELERCGHIALAHKPASDGVYIGGIDVDQFLHFLDRSAFPRWISDHVKDARDELSYALFDVGFDFVVTDGEVEITKWAYYGAV